MVIFYGEDHDVTDRHFHPAISLSVCPWKSLLPSLMFGGEARSLKGDSRRQVPTLLANIRLGFKGLSGTNTLVYYKQL
jgi:hypothetical protein